MYVCRRILLDLLRGLDHLESFRDDVVPWLCKAQYQATKRQTCLQSECTASYHDRATHLQPVLRNQKISSSQSSALDHSTTTRASANPAAANAWPNVAVPSQESRSVHRHSSPNAPSSPPLSPVGSDNDPTAPFLPSLKMDVLLCSATSTAAAGFVARVNTLDSFLRANRHVCASSKIPSCTRG